MPFGILAQPTDCGPTPLTSLTSPNITYYWIAAAGQQAMNYQYTLNNGNSNSATVTFNVGGPTAPTLLQTLIGNVNVGLDSDGDPAVGLYGLPKPAVVLDPGTDGVIFQAAAPGANWGSGQYSWVQVIQQDTVYVLVGGAPTNPQAASGLDGTSVPYKASYASQQAVQGGYGKDLAVDAPNNCLEGLWGEEARSFYATTYLMWEPQADPNCVGGDCTIPIPLGSIAWEWKDDAINTAKGNTTTWTLGAPGGCVLAPQPQFQPGDANPSYPHWNQFPKQMTLSCQ